MKRWARDECQDCEELANTCVWMTEQLQDSPDLTREALWDWWRHCYKAHMPALDKPAGV